MSEAQGWSTLPDEVVASIFSRLSVYDIVRAGCVCRRLRSFVSSHTFSASPSASLLLLVHPFASASVHEDAPSSSGWAYDRTRDAWLKLSLSFLQPNLPDFAYPVASDRGLLCFGSGREFLVCNPISRSWRRLPSVPHVVHMENGQSFPVSFNEDSVHAFGLARKPNSDTYYFVVINFESEKSLKMMWYISSLSQWKGMPSVIMAEPCKLRSSAIVIIDSRVYTLWEKGSFLVVFAYSNDRWSEIESPDCTSTLLKAFLMDVHGSLHMVGGVGAVWLQDNLWGQPTSVRVWKLHAQSNEWMEVTRMPSSILHEFRAYIDFDEVQCCGKDGVMYMKSSRSDVLMYDLSKNEWKWLQDLEMDVGLGSFILEPSLSASA